MDNNVPLRSYVARNRHLCGIIWESENKKRDPVDIILDKLRATTTYKPNQLDQIRWQLGRVFKSYYKKHWNSSKVSRKQDRFEAYHASWLDSDFIINFGAAENEGEDDLPATHSIDHDDLQVEEDVSMENEIPDFSIDFTVNPPFPGNSNESERNYIEPSTSNDVQNNDNYEDDDEHEGEYDDDELDSLVQKCVDNISVKTRGRPSTSFADGSRTTKYRRTIELAGKCITPQLAQALAMRKNMSINYNSFSTVDMKNYSNLSSILAMYLDLDFSARTYNIFRKHNSRIAGVDVYPPYPCIQLIKRGSFPCSMEFTETGGCADLNSLLEHTVTKILLTMNKEEWNNFSRKELTLVGKWGMDGASGQQTTRQKWQQESVNPSEVKTAAKKKNVHKEVDSTEDYCDDESEDIEVDLLELQDNQPQNERQKPYTPKDKSVFSVSFVPLQLKDNDTLLWSNPSPSSVFYCRPIEFNFTKETKEHVLNRYNFYKEQFGKENTLIFRIDRLKFVVNLDFECTMIDGKTCNVLTKQDSTRSCNICRVGPKKINDLKYINDKCPPSTEYYSLGLSTLHCWIRCFEYILHLSYNLDFERGSAYTAEDKKMKAERKLKVQDSLRKKMSVLVDIVKQGFGTTILVK